MSSSTVARLKVVSVTHNVARAFVDRHHRHHSAAAVYCADTIRRRLGRSNDG